MGGMFWQNEIMMIKLPPRPEDRGTKKLVEFW